VRTILPTGRPLIGRFVRLDLLTETDLPEMFPLLSDPEIYASGYVMHRRPDSVQDAVELARERFLPGQGRADGTGRGRTSYAVRLVADSDLGAAGTLVGTSSPRPTCGTQSIHLGSTLYGRRWWGTRVNPEAKLLLMSHCSDRCGYGRVKIQIDLLNTRSPAAIAKLGAQREDGTFRDSVVFSVLADEWPAVKAGLEGRLKV
jgi:RimJ/RimL family protein N-acetyltransferase